HRRAPLRSWQGTIPGFRAVLGIRLRPDPCGRVRPEPARQHVRTAAGVSEGAGKEPADVAHRPAVLRPCRHRRREPGHDRDAQGLERHGAVVDADRAEARLIVSSGRPAGSLRPETCPGTLPPDGAGMSGVLIHGAFDLLAWLTAGAAGALAPPRGEGEVPAGPPPPPLSPALPSRA